MKKLVLLATFTFLASNAVANWTTNAWPATNYFRYVSSNDYTRITNEAVVGQSELTFTVSSSMQLPNYSTNGYTYTCPQTNIVLYTLNGTNIYGNIWDRRSWNLHDLTIPLRAWTWGYNTEESLAPTMHVPTNTDTNGFSITNEFYSFIQLADWTAAGLGLGDNNSGAYTNTYDVISGGVTQDFEEVLTWFTTNVLDSEGVILSAKDVRAYDCYQAIEERVNARTNQFNSGVTPYRVRPPRLYRFERDNIVNLKTELGKLINLFTGSGVFWMDTAIKGTNDNYDVFMATNIGETLTYDLVGLTVSNALLHAGAPTNYLEYTPYRQLNGWGYPYGHFVTNTYVLQGDTDPVTNYVFGYLGETNVLTGTNGQVVTTITTNNNIQIGYSELDYGWKYMTNIITQVNELGWARGGDATKFAYVGNRYESGVNYISWDDAKSNVYSITNGGDYLNTKAYATYGVNYTSPTSRRAVAYQYGVTNILTGVETNSGLDKRVHFYNRGISDFAGFDERIFDNNGFQISSNITQFIDVTGYTNISTFVSPTVIGADSGPPAWCGDPGVYIDAGSETFRGFYQAIGTDEGYRIIEWDWEYK